MTSFKDQYTFEERLKESSKIIAKYPDRVPVIVEIKEDNSLFYKNEKLPNIENMKKKFLVPKDLPVASFQLILRNKMKLNEKKAMFLFVDNTIPSATATIGSIYDSHKDEDFYLYVNVCGESVFGSA